MSGSSTSGVVLWEGADERAGTKAWGRHQGLGWTTPSRGGGPISSPRGSGSWAPARADQPRGCHGLSPSWAIQARETADEHPIQTAAAEGDKNWVDPIIGLRTIWTLGERLSLIAAGDIGGTSENSDYSWQAIGLVGYRFGLFGTNNANLVAGYRALHQKYHRRQDHNLLNHMSRQPFVAGDRRSPTLSHFDPITSVAMRLVGQKARKCLSFLTKWRGLGDRLCWAAEGSHARRFLQW